MTYHLQYALRPVLLIHVFVSKSINTWMKVYINCETECDINKRSYDALGGLAGLSKTWFQHK